MLNPKRNDMTTKNLHIFRLGILLLLVLAIPIEITAKENKSDIVKISGKAVVFFGPSQKEYKLAPPDEKNALSELLSDLFSHSNKLRAYLEEQGIDSGTTSSNWIEIKLNNKQKLLFKRRELGSEVGYIMMVFKSRRSSLTSIQTMMSCPQLKRFLKFKIEQSTGSKRHSIFRAAIS